jgi:hypothetical protein
MLWSLLTGTYLGSYSEAGSFRDLISCAYHYKKGANKSYKNAAKSKYSGSKQTL